MAREKAKYQLVRLSTLAGKPSWLIVSDGYKASDGYLIAEYQYDNRTDALAAIERLTLKG